MHWPENYSLKILEPVYNQIRQFYRNVHKKHRNVYGKEQIKSMIINAFNSINNLHGYKLISDSILDKWKGFGRVVVGQWHFAIDIKGNKVTVVDACHQQNMTNNHTIAEMFEADLNTQVQRITDITFPPPRGNHHFIRCKIDGEQQFLHEIPSKYLHKYKTGELTKYQLLKNATRKS